MQGLFEPVALRRGNYRHALLWRALAYVVLAVVASVAGARGQSAPVPAHDHVALLLQRVTTAPLSNKLLTGTTQAATSSSSTSSGTDQQGSPKHIFVMIPAYNVQYLKNVKPLTSREKLMEVVHDTYDPQGLALGAAEAALLEHQKDGFCGYGPGWGGFGKCYGAALLDANVSGFLGDWAFPSLMHQDPRYFRVGTGSVPSRVLYAFSRVFITRTDAGGTTVDSSALLGTVISGAVSNTYYPKHDRGFGLTVSRIAIDLGGTALFNLEAEFWADVQKLWKPKVAYNSGH